MERTKQAADPRVFWVKAAQIGAFLAQQGAEEECDPLVWVAGLTMAQEAILAAGGTAMREDYERACVGRQKLAESGTTFSVEHEPGPSPVVREYCERCGEPDTMVGEGDERRCRQCHARVS